MWLAGAASMLANQKAGAESGDVDVLQEKQKELKVLRTFLLFIGHNDITNANTYNLNRKMIIEYNLSYIIESLYLSITKCSLYSQSIRFSSLIYNCLN